jgi:hypothetical protein
MLAHSDSAVYFGAHFVVIGLEVLEDAVDLFDVDRIVLHMVDGLVEQTEASFFCNNPEFEIFADLNEPNRASNEI